MFSVNTTSPNDFEQELIELYQSGKGVCFLQNKYHISKEKVKVILKENNIHIRNRHEAIVAGNKNRNLLNNHAYFQTESRNMAWLLGFLAADGCIEKDRNVIKISLSSADKEILEKIRKEISLQSEVKDYVDSSGFAKSKLQWSSEQHKKDLSTYHIIPQKTFALKPPEKLSNEFIIDYLRGYWDGDGSITVINNNYNSLEWQITSATKEILEFFVNYLYDTYGIPKVNIHSYKRNDHELYLLQYSTKASLRLNDIMYKDISIDDLFIKRKKDKYDKIVQEKLNLK